MTRKCSDSEIIAALMGASTITEAAEMLGVSRRSMYNYLSDETLDAKLKEAQETRDRELRRIQETAAAEAIASLVEIASSDCGLWSGVTAKDRIDAARTILTYGNPKTQAAKG